ncbi:protein YgfX [Accumulibacter sp.]|uniref:protein YgfX n=1 Tax=Accumulibacter sp. TaxID=2053492 RepID=UPI002636D7BA|nr:protein YgfX [Accumulibacter sp.]
MQFPLRIALRRSRLLASLLVSLHATAAACLWVLPWPLLPRGALLAVVAVSAWWTLRPSSVAGLRLQQDGALLLLLVNGEPLAVAIQSGTAVFSQLIVLRLRDDSGRRLRTLVLLPDSVSTGHFRVLRLWLRWRAGPSDHAAGDA